MHWDQGRGQDQGWVMGAFLLSRNWTPLLIDAHMQVHPEKLTRALLRAAEARGAQLVRGEVQGAQLNATGDRIEGA